MGLDERQEMEEWVAVGGRVLDGGEAGLQRQYQPVHQRQHACVICETIHPGTTVLVVRRDKSSSSRLVPDPGLAGISLVLLEG